LLFDHCVFKNNAQTTTTGYGGALVLKGTVVDVKHCIFENNTSVLAGSAVSANNSANIYDCLFKGNRSTSISTTPGGAIVHYTTGQVLIENCTFEENTAAGSQAGAAYST
jgi:hypothetical protein